MDLRRMQNLFSVLRNAKERGFDHLRVLRRRRSLFLPRSAARKKAKSLGLRRLSRGQRKAAKQQCEERCGKEAGKRSSLHNVNFRNRVSLDTVINLIILLINVNCIVFQFARFFKFKRRINVEARTDGKHGLSS